LEAHVLGGVEERNKKKGKSLLGWLGCKRPSDRETFRSWVSRGTQKDVMHLDERRRGFEDGSLKGNTRNKSVKEKKD